MRGLKFYVIVIWLLLLGAKVESAPQKNPFYGKRFMVSEAFRGNILNTMRSSSKTEQNALERVSRAPTAFWLTEEFVQNDERKPAKYSLRKTLEGASNQTPIPIITMVIYNLPNRDCSGGASSGNICCNSESHGSCNLGDNGNCADGLNKYKKSYIDKIAEIVGRHCKKVPMSFIVEPDALASLVTSATIPSCQARSTKTSYREGIKYAVEKLSETCPQSAIYIDVAHGNWMGWDKNALGLAMEIQKMNIMKKIRGFATNISNYNVLGTKCPRLDTCTSVKTRKHPCCRVDPCNTSQTNPGFTELNYVEQLRSKIQGVLKGSDPHFVIDTSRNSEKNGGEYCNTFCNPRNSGMGVFPTWKTADTSIIDAYLWIKIPGESDGCTSTLPNGASCPRFTSKCASMYSIGSKGSEPRAPEAGDWFSFQAKQLAIRAEK